MYRLFGGVIHRGCPQTQPAADRKLSSEAPAAHIEGTHASRAQRPRFDDAASVTWTQVSQAEVQQPAPAGLQARLEAVDEGPPLLHNRSSGCINVAHVVDLPWHCLNLRGFPSLFRAPHGHGSERLLGGRKGSFPTARAGGFDSGVINKVPAA